MKERKKIHWSSLRVMLIEYFVCALCIGLTFKFWNIYTIILCIIIVGVRQHALFIMYHDAVHYQISSNKRLNDFIINVFVGVPFLLPIHLYRGLHLAHHNEIGSEADPEILLYHRGQRWKYKALPAVSFLLQLLGDLTMWNNIKTIGYFIVEMNKKPRKLTFVKSKIYPELYVMLVLYVFFLFVIYINYPLLVNKLLLLWVLPFYTVTQMLQKLRSFTEHVFSEQETYTGSWSPTIIGRLILWPYNINYHREHHERPNIPWDQLPLKYPNAEQRSGLQLWDHLVYNGTKS